MSRESLVSNIEKIIFGVAIFYFALFPVFFMTNVSEFTEYPKLLLSIVVSGALVLLWSLKSIIARKINVVRTPFDIPFVLLLVSFVLSTWSSLSFNDSVFGQFNNWHLTAAELFSFLTIFYAISSNVKGIGRAKVLHYVLYFSSFVLALLGILVYFNVLDGLTGDVLGVFARDGFSPAGGTHSMVLVLTVALFSGLFFLKSFYKNNKFAFLLHGLVVVTVATGLVLWLSPFIPGIPERGVAVQQLSFNSSWQVASLSIRSYPFFGTGPSTFSIAYNGFKPEVMNDTDYWNVTFARSGSEYMTLLTTVGLFGFLAFLALVWRVIAVSKQSMMSSFSSEKGGNLVPVVMSAIAILVVYLFTSSTVMSTGLLFIVLSLWVLYAKNMDSLDSFDDISMSFTATGLRRVENEQENTSQIGQVLPWIVSVPLVAVAGFIMFYTVKDVDSNAQYTKSLLALNTNASASEIYDYQRQAIQLNPRRDVYYRSFSEVNIRLAEVVAQERGETITDSERGEVLNLIQDSINTVRFVSEVVNPRVAANWQQRGNVYRRLLGVANGADSWALGAYQQAIVLSPQDPRIRVDLGGLYLAIALLDGAQLDGQQGDEPPSQLATAPETKRANLALAEASFLSAIRLKEDYANAHFNLGLVYKEAGQYELAKEEFEVTARLIPGGTPDAQAAQDQLDIVNGLLESAE